MSDGYKQPITSTYDARWNLCREIKEHGKVGSPSATALMFYLTASAWWGDKYGKKQYGSVDPKHASPLRAAQYVGLSKSSVYAAMATLEDGKWITTWEVRPGEIGVTVLLDEQARQTRAAHRRKVPRSGKKFRDLETDSEIWNEIPRSGIATVSDLRKHAPRN